MSELTLGKLRASTMEKVFPRLALSGQSAELIRAEPDPVIALDLLEQSGFLSEAAKLIAHALPPREGVWWACMCAHHTAPANLAAPDRAAAAAAETWVRNQSDESRRDAFDHAQQGGFGSPEAWAAVAAFWSGDSMSPIGLPKTPPAPHLTGTAVIGSVVLAAVRTHPERREERLRHFLASGREIASGKVGRLMPEETT